MWVELQVRKHKIVANAYRVGCFPHQSKEVAILADDSNCHYYGWDERSSLFTQRCICRRIVKTKIRKPTSNCWGMGAKTRNGDWTTVCVGYSFFNLLSSGVLNKKIWSMAQNLHKKCYRKDILRGFLCYLWSYSSDNSDNFQRYPGITGPRPSPRKLDQVWFHLTWKIFA